MPRHRAEKVGRVTVRPKEREDAPIRQTGTNVPARSENREGLPRYALRWNWAAGASGSGFTAVLRVKNEARSLPWVLPGILRSVERAVVVDNGSTDGTAEVAEGIGQQAGLGEKLQVLSYPFAVSRCGPEHLQTYPDSVHSLVYYYNWSFSQVRTGYSLKWDGDMVLTPQGEQVLRDLSWQLQGIDGTVRMALSPVYVESDRVAYVDLALTHRELCGWRNTPDHTFVKCFDWEVIMPWADDLLQLPDWACFELKWLDRDQFSHWSGVDFRTVRHPRKRREWEVSQAILGGGEIPKKVVRVESPEGVHVIEHLRQTYTELRRRGPANPAANANNRTAKTRTLDGRGGGPPRLPERDPSPVPRATRSEEIPHE